ncbi:protein of unknown function DUF583 [Shewanella baltica OS155]|uniref:Uncharacterized protein n=1 Tax=Shewanella baltica (strain OS155 / ATCC BAA-1091) TaxID=325240 RepID=A3D851_SHEB5|nr:protein of unknown function DUF583 [Shewanella baltica OS155]
MSDSPLNTEVSPVAQGLDAEKAANPLLTEQTTAPDTANADNTAALSADTDPLALSQDSAMEDLQQMEQGHAQMAQGDNGTAPTSENAGNKL